MRAKTLKKYYSIVQKYMTKTMIDAEQEESDEAQDLKLPNVLMKCVEKASV